MVVYIKTDQETAGLFVSHDSVYRSDSLRCIVTQFTKLHEVH